jgi:opacity protein-like surface antigen
MLKKTAVVGLAGLVLGVSPAAADSIDNGATVALTMIGGGGAMSLACMAIALLTQDDEDEQEGYDRRGFYAGLGPIYARENFSDSAVVDLVDGDLQDALRAFRGTPVKQDLDAVPKILEDGDPGAYTFNLDDVDDDAFGFSGRVGYRCHPYISTELQFDWLDDFDGALSENPNGITNEGVPEPDTARKFDLELESLVFTTNMKGHLLTGRYQPFVLVGLGFMRMESKTRDASGGAIPGSAPQGSDRTVKVAMRFGGGLDFYITKNVLASAEFSYLMPTGKLEDLDYYSIGVGMQYRF